MNQKGFIALIFFVVCLCLSAVIVGLSYYYVHYKPIENQELTGTEEKLSNKILQNESPSTVGNKKPLLLYSYSYKQFGKDNQQTFKLDPSNMNKQEIQIGYDYGKKWFKSSPDGKYLLRYGLEKLEIAASTNLSTFKTLVELDGFNSYIDIFNVYWSNDASKILYVLDKKTLFSENTEIYLINKDGSNNKLVKSFANHKNFNILGFNLEKSELYWYESFQNRNNFTVVNLTDGSIKEVIPDLDPADSTPVNYSSSTNSLYFVPEEGENRYKIVKYSINDKEKKAIYLASSIFMETSPNGQFLVFGGYKPAKIQGSDPLQIINIINLQNNQLESLDGSCVMNNLGDYNFSPDGNYFTYSAQCLDDIEKSSFSFHYYVMDIPNKKDIEVFKDKAGNYADPNSKSFETIKFIGWISE